MDVPPPATGLPDPPISGDLLSSLISALLSGLGSRG
jgi:hypothetical protein